MDWRLGLALAFMGLHVVAPRLGRFLARRNVAVNSCGGGMAVAYVFVHMLPELDEGHALFGDPIYMIVLIGFVVFYGLDVYLAALAFEMRVFLAMLYTGLLIYAMPGVEVHITALVAFLSMGTHVVYRDYSMRGQRVGSFDRWAHWLLALAPLLGWTAHAIAPPRSEGVADLVMAVFAGNVIYGVFVELPERDRSFPWFVTGVSAQVLLYVLAGSL